MDQEPTKWYNLVEEERIKQIYCKYTINDFWDWWVGKEQKVMEVRIKNFDLLKKVANKLNMKYSSSGIYVWNSSMLKCVMKEVRDIATIWWGLNPRKMNCNKFGSKSFGGTDNNVKQIDILFIDIDRIKKDTVATYRELENCDKLANIILERLATQGWNKNYAKICSGNGVQLYIKLDVAIKLPEIEYIASQKGGHFVYNEEFEKLKLLIRNGIGNDIVKFCKQYKNELECEVDKAGFNIGRVGALPFTKNFKYGGFTYRGIIELENGNNDGFTDYILSREDDLPSYMSRGVFNTKAVKLNNKIRKEKIQEHPLIRYMLDNEIPEGMRNNYLWFQVKCLIRDSNIDFNSEEFKKIHSKIEKKQHAIFPNNIPADTYHFNEYAVNKYFFHNLLPPLYPPFSERTKKLNMLIDDIKWELLAAFDIGNRIKLDGTDIIEDTKLFSKILKVDDYANKEKFVSFLFSCIEVYSEKVTKYHFEHTMIKLLCYV